MAASRDGNIACLPHQRCPRDACVISMTSIYRGCYRTQGCYGTVGFDVPHATCLPATAHLPFDLRGTAMYMKRKRLPVVVSRLQAIMVAAVFCLAFSNASTVAQDTVRVGVGVDPSFTSWWVAADKGFFAKRNL